VQAQGGEVVFQGFERHASSRADSKWRECNGFCFAACPRAGTPALLCSCAPGLSTTSCACTRPGDGGGSSGTRGRRDRLRRIAMSRKGHILETR
jgi:hypothetical protein